MFPPLFSPESVAGSLSLEASFLLFLMGFVFLPFPFPLFPLSIDVSSSLGGPFLPFPFFLSFFPLASSSGRVAGPLLDEPSLSF